MTGNINIVNSNLCGNLPNRICAGPDYVSGCPGDDGGPVVCNGILSGLIDFTDANYCSNTVAGRHTPYINIADYYAWIVENSIQPPNVDDNGGAAQIAFSLIALASSAILLKLFN